MAYKITQEFLSKFMEYYNKYECRPIYFADFTGSLSFITLLEEGVLTRMGSNLLPKIVKAITNQDNNTEIMHELESLLKPDIDEETQRRTVLLDDDSKEKEIEQNANMTYALRDSFRDKLRDLRIGANYKSLDLSAALGRSASYISHLEKGVIRAVNKNDLADITLILTNNLLGKTFKIQEKKLKIENQEDIIRYLIPSMQENPKKLRKIFSKNEKEGELDGLIEISEDLSLTDEQSLEVDALCNDAFVAIKAMVKAQHTVEDQTAFIKSLVEFLSYQNHQLINDIVQKNYLEIKSEEILDKFLLDWNQLCEKYSIK